MNKCRTIAEIVDAEGEDEASAHGCYFIEGVERRRRWGFRGPYPSLSGAAETLRAAMGWEQIFISSAYKVARGTAYSACPTRDACDAAAGVDPPRIVRHAAITYTIALDYPGLHVCTVLVTPETAAKVALDLCERELPDSALRRLPLAIAEELFDAATAVRAGPHRASG